MAMKLCGKVEYIKPAGKGRIGVHFYSGDYLELCDRYRDKRAPIKTSILEELPIYLDAWNTKCDKYQLNGVIGESDQVEYTSFSRMGYDNGGKFVKKTARRKEVTVYLNSKGEFEMIGKRILLCKDIQERMKDRSLSLAPLKNLELLDLSKEKSRNSVSLDYLIKNGFGDFHSDIIFNSKEALLAPQVKPFLSYNFHQLTFPL
jgi:hypothetical protein